MSAYVNGKQGTINVPANSFYQRFVTWSDNEHRHRFHRAQNKFANIIKHLGGVSWHREASGIIYVINYEEVQRFLVENNEFDPSATIDV
jgi:hypothetical protein